MSKQVLKIEGYRIEPARRSGWRNIMVLKSDNCVVDFEDLNSAEYPLLISAFESCPEVLAYVVADSKGAFIYGDDDLVREV